MERRTRSIAGGHWSGVGLPAGTAEDRPAQAAGGGAGEGGGRCRMTDQAKVKSFGTAWRFGYVETIRPVAVNVS